MVRGLLNKEAQAFLKRLNGKRLNGRGLTKWRVLLTGLTGLPQNAFVKEMLEIKRPYL